MRALPTRLLFRTVLVVSLAFAAPLFAQGDAEGDQPSSEASGEDIDREDIDRGVSPFETEEKPVPVSKFLEVSETWLKEMRENLTKGLDLLREARDSKDAVRLQCVNEKIAAMKGVLRVSEDAYIALQEAMATRATERARHEFTKIKTSYAKMSELIQGARNCVGAEATFTGDTEVDVEIDPALAEQDPYYREDFFYTPEDQLANPPDDGVGGEDAPERRPPLLSAYQGCARKYCR